jgi:hypothetical protein
VILRKIPIAGNVVTETPGHLLKESHAVISVAICLLTAMSALNAGKLAL